MTSLDHATSTKTTPIETSPDDPTEGSPKASTQTARPRSAWGLMRDRTFGPFFLAKLLSTIGVWIHNIAAAILVWDLTESTMLVGAVSIGQFLPQAFLSPWSGARADRGDRRRQLILGRIVTAIGSGGLALWIFVIGVEGTSGAAAVIIAATVVGIGFALGAPAINALVPNLVRPNELPTAIALNSLPMTVARSAGPALGALLVATAGAAASFALAAALNVFFAIVIAVIYIRPTHRDPKADTSVRAGWRYLRSDLSMSALMIGIIAVGLGADPVITLTPAIADRLGEGSGFVGTLASAFGIGAAFGFVVLRRMQLWFGLPRLGMVGLFGLALGMGSLAFAPTSAIATAALVVGGVGMAFSLTSLTTLIQQQVPEELRGRIMALWAVAFLGSRPIAAGLTGAITDATSVTVSLLLVTVALIAGALVVRPSRVNPYRRIELGD